MDLADDVAYSVHDIEDGIVAGRVDLTRLDLDAVWQTVREWYVPSASDGVLDEVLSALRSQVGWPVAPYDGGRRGQAALKDLTSDLIGRFCGAVQAATFASSSGPFVRHRADLVVPEQTRLEIAVLKGIAAHYVMRADDRVELMIQQRDLLTGLVERPARPRTRCVGDPVRRGLEGGGRRRRPLPRGHRPGRVVDRCVGGRLARHGWWVDERTAGLAAVRGRRPARRAAVRDRPRPCPRPAGEPRRGRGLRVALPVRAW